LSDRGPWIETFTGRAFYLLDPQPEDIFIEDIAHSLSQMCRFTCHTRKFYSVAEHSYYISLMCKPENALWGLLDDSDETYTGDMNRPLKHHTEMGRLFRAIAEPIKKAIATRFSLPWPVPTEVKLWDDGMLFAEKREFMTRLPWDTCGKCGTETTVDDVIIPIGYPSEVIEKIFLTKFHELTESHHAVGG
jgi:hypothetical protein